MLKRFLNQQLILVCCLTPTLVAQGTTEAMRREARKYQLTSSGVHLEFASTREGFSAVLQSAKLPGGITTSFGCESQSGRSLSLPPGLPLADALEPVVSLEGIHYWTFQQGVVDLLPANGVPDVLNTTIGHFEWNTGTRVLPTLDQLFASPSVRSRLKELGLTSALDSIILLQKAPQMVDGRPVVAANGEERVVENATLLSILNAIVASHGVGMWSYEERRCGSEKTFHISTVEP